MMWNNQFSKTFFRGSSESLNFFYSIRIFGVEIVAFLSKNMCFLEQIKEEINDEKIFQKIGKKLLTRGEWCVRIIRLTALRQSDVPCKLNNAKTNRTPWTILSNGNCLSVLERKTANEILE